MQISAIQPHVMAQDIAPESLAGNRLLSDQEKIAEASRQFEGILLRQILESSTKTVIQSRFADNSTASSIYHGLVTEQLADSISKSGAFGLARTFEQQLSPPASSAVKPAAIATSHE